MKIEIDITEEQEKYLKEFANKQYPGAKDNLCTAMPIHVVQTRDDVYFEPNSEYGENNIFIDEDGNEYNTAEEVVRCYYECYGEDPKIEIEGYEYGMTLKDEQGKTCIIQSYEEYFEIYKMEWEDVQYLARVKRYSDVAFFFILEEAKRYIKYQSHNLNNPRVYTYSGGYGNDGEYTHFFNLLMSIGKQLNTKEI